MMTTVMVMMNVIGIVGLDQPSHPPDMSGGHDGSTSDPGSVAPGRGPHGRAYHPRDDDAAEVSAQDGRVRLFESDRHAEPT